MSHVSSLFFMIYFTLCLGAGKIMSDHAGVRQCHLCLGRECTRTLAAARLAPLTCDITYNTTLRRLFMR